MKKHYGLENYNEQNNNFVIYDDFFDKNYKPPHIADKGNHHNNNYNNKGKNQTSNKNLANDHGKKQSEQVYEQRKQDSPDQERITRQEELYADKTRKNKNPNAQNFDFHKQNYASQKDSNIYHENNENANRKTKQNHYNHNSSNDNPLNKLNSNPDPLEIYHQNLSKKDTANIKDIDKQIERTQNDINNIKKDMERLNKEAYYGSDNKNSGNNNYKNMNKPTEDDIKAYNRALYQTTSKQYGNYYYK